MKNTKKRTASITIGPRFEAVILEWQKKMTDLIGMEPDWTTTVESLTVMGAKTLKAQGDLEAEIPNSTKL